MQSSVSENNAERSQAVRAPGLELRPVVQVIGEDDDFGTMAVEEAEIVLDQ